VLVQVSQPARLLGQHKCCAGESIAGHDRAQLLLQSLLVASWRTILRPLIQTPIEYTSVIVYIQRRDKAKKRTVLHKHMPPPGLLELYQLQPALVLQGIKLVAIDSIIEGCYSEAL
jgi:hypothetical protein